MVLGLGSFFDHPPKETNLTLILLHQFGMPLDRHKFSFTIDRFYGFNETITGPGRKRRFARVGIEISLRGTPGSRRKGVECNFAV